jgi:HEAT repeat protein
MYFLCAALIHSAMFARVPQTNWETIGEITAYGQTDPDSRVKPAVKVPIKFPTDSFTKVDPDAPFVPWNDWKIAINKYGNIGRAFKAEGGWSEFKQLYSEAQKRIAAGKSNVWKIKCVIFRRTNVLYRNGSGVLETQRAYISDPEEKFCLETFARFGAMLEAFSQGAVKAELVFSIEEEPIVGSYSGDETWTFDPRDAGRDYLRGRFNRGDYDSVIYMFHPGNANAFSFGGTAGRINHATASYVILSNGREHDARIGHTEAMLHEFLHQIEQTCAEWGYGGWEEAALPDLHGAEKNGRTENEMGSTGWFCWMRDYMTTLISQGMWAKLKNRTDPDYVSAISQTHKFDGTSRRWDDVKDDPWAKLPYLTENDLGSRLGGTFQVQASGSALLFSPQGGSAQGPFVQAIDPNDSELNNELNFTTEAIARVQYGSRDLLFVKWDSAPFVLENLEGGSPEVLGYLSKDSKLVVVCDVPHTNDTRSELNLLSLGTGAVKSAVSDRGAVASFRASGSSDVRFTVSTLSGEAVQIQDSGALAAPRDQNVLRLTTMLPDGSRSERPFVIRRAPPVSISLEPVGTRRISSESAQIAIIVRSDYRPANLTLSLTLPSGWSASGLPEQIALAPYQTQRIEAEIVVPNSSADGPYQIALSADIQGWNGDHPTARLTLMRDTREAIQNDDFESGIGNWGAPREDNGSWKVSAAPGGHTGSCLQIADAGGTRWGRVNVFGLRDADGKLSSENLGYDTASYPYLDFWLKTTAKHNLSLCITLDAGKRAVVMLTGAYKEQWGQSVELRRAKFIPNGEWQHVVYDLNAALNAAFGNGPHYVVDIGFGDSRTFCSNQNRDGNQMVHFIDDFKIARRADPAAGSVQDDPDAEINIAPDPASPNLEARALAAAQLTAGADPSQVQAVRSLLADKSPSVRLNAANAFTRVKDTQAAAALNTIVKIESDQTVMAYMVKALAFQDTPEGWQTIAQIPKLGRRDEQGIQEAIKQMGAKNDEKLVREVTTAITCNSWITRAQGAESLGAMPFESAKLDQMTFLFEVDPHVRMAVGMSADVSVDLVRRRMEWGSINDLSDVVRAYDYAALTRSADPVVRSHGYSGLKEADPEIRTIIAEQLGNDPKPYHVSMLTELLRDPVPDVRAAALKSLLAMPGGHEWQQVAALESEQYEQVLLPLLDAARSGKLKPPAVLLQRLLSHRSPEVRKRAKEIGT